MRVMLFTQTGDARPKRSRGRRWREHPEMFWGISWREIVELIAFDRDGADRWWLVECENADAGRALLAALTMRTHHGPRSWQRKALDRAHAFKLKPAGRILSSGGRPAAKEDRK